MLGSSPDAAPGSHAPSARHSCQWLLRAARSHPVAPRRLGLASETAALRSVDKKGTRVEYQTLRGACCSCRIHPGATGTGGTASSGLVTLVLACVYGGKWLLPQCDAGAEEGQTSAHVARTRCLSHSFSFFPCSRPSHGHCMTYGEEAVEHSTKVKRRL